MENTKITNRSLLVLDYLWNHTDEKHQATTNDILDAVKATGADLERHALPGIISELQAFGVDIVFRKSSPNRYYVNKRELSLPEIKLLIDAVDTAGFISAQQSKELVNKIVALAEPSARNELKRHVYIDSRPKSECETLFATVDTIHNAILRCCRIEFQYFEYTLGKKRAHKHGSSFFYQLSPYALVWNDDYYYVLGYCEQHGHISKFRVDRIDNISITELMSRRKPTGFEPVKYLQSLFSMYDGELQKVTLKCDADMMKVIIDRFGKGVKTKIIDDSSFYAYVEISVSQTFFGWLFGFAGKIAVVSPQNVKDDYMNMARAALNNEN